MTVTDSTGYQCLGVDLADPRRSATATSEHEGMRVTASNPRRSETTDAEGAVDCDVMVVLPWATLLGIVTVGPMSDSNPTLDVDGMAAFGCKPDHWISRQLLRSLASTLEADPMMGIMEAMEATACALAGAVL